MSPPWVGPLPPMGWVPVPPWRGCLYHPWEGACTTMEGACTTHGRVPNHCFGCQIHCFLSQKSAKIHCFLSQKSAKIHCFRSQNTPFSEPKYTVFGAKIHRFRVPNTPFSGPQIHRFRVQIPCFRTQIPCFRTQIPCFTVFSDPNTVFYRVFGSHMPKYRVFGPICQNTVFWLKSRF